MRWRWDLPGPEWRTAESSRGRGRSRHCGDLNARVKDIQDSIPDVDNLVPRTPIDLERGNAHGTLLIDFLRDGKCCLINSRITPEYDDFTCVSVKGKSVVDYIITDHTSIGNVTECKVLGVTSLMESLNLMGLIGERSRPPDHSVLVTKICVYTSTMVELTNTHVSEDELNTNVQQNAIPLSSGKKYNFNIVRNRFQTSDLLSVNQFIKRQCVIHRLPITS